MKITTAHCIRCQTPADDRIITLSSLGLSTCGLYERLANVYIFLP